MKKAGIILILIGLAITAFTGFDLITRKKVVDIGNLEISTRENHSFSWSPVIGIITMAFGAGFFLARTKNN